MAATYQVIRVSTTNHGDFRVHVDDCETVQIAIARSLKRRIRGGHKVRVNYMSRSVFPYDYTVTDRNNYVIASGECRYEE